MTQRLCALLTVIGLLVLTSWASVAGGLLMSAAVNTENQATSFIPLVLIPQLLLGGQLKPFHDLPVIMRDLASVIFSRWSFAGIGHVAKFNDRLRETGRAGTDPLKHYGASFFKLGIAPTVGILAAFIAVFLAGTAIGLRRQRT